MKYIHGLGRLPLIEIDETGNTRINIFDESGMIGVMENGNKVNYLLKDHLGSTRVVVDEAGEKRGELNYSDFGETTTSGDVENIRYRYTGQEWDEELEEYNYLAREYDPVTARFNSLDPARQGFSPYVYVGNNPINFVDPDGEVYVLSKDKYSSLKVDKRIKRWDSKNQRCSDYIDPAIGVNAEMVISKYDKSNKEELERLSKDLKKWEKDFSKNEDIIDAHASKTWDEIYTLMELSLVVEEYDYFVARSESDTLLGVGVLDRGEGYTLSLNLRDPNALVVREKRQADVVGNVGTQIRNEMINWSFENGATEVISRPMSSRAKSSLKEIGFVDVERFF